MAKFHMYRMGQAGRITCLKNATPTGRVSSRRGIGIMPFCSPHQSVHATSPSRGKVRDAMSSTCRAKAVPVSETMCIVGDSISIILQTSICLKVLRVLYSGDSKYVCLRILFEMATILGVWKSHMDDVTCFHPNTNLFNQKLMILYVSYVVCLHTHTCLLHFS
jgi:hypothetical protein